MITNKQAIRLARKFNVDLSVVPINQLMDGLNIELEHGTKLGQLTNITNNDLDKTMRIVIAHLIEDPQYYKYLKPLEKRRERYWKHRNKPMIFK